MAECFPFHSRFAEKPQNSHIIPGKKSQPEGRFLFPHQLLQAMMFFLHYQKFIKGISILLPMGPQGVIDLVGKRSYKYRIIHHWGEKWDRRLGFKPAAQPLGSRGVQGSEEMGQVCQFLDCWPLAPLMTLGLHLYDTQASLPSTEKQARKEEEQLRERQLRYDPAVKVSWRERLGHWFLRWLPSVTSWEESAPKWSPLPDFQYR